MPTEFALCGPFGASRFTVREAVKQLVAMGLVSRQAGVGTRVPGTHGRTACRQAMRGISDLRRYTADTELEIVAAEMVEVDAALRDQRRGEIIEVAISTHPAGRFSYGETFRQDWRGAPEETAHGA